MSWLDHLRRKGDHRESPIDRGDASGQNRNEGGTVLWGVPKGGTFPELKPADALPDFTEGARIAGVYTISRRIGAGAMGKVYLARHEEWGFDVVLKVPNSRILADAENRHRITREAEIWTDLGLHPHIAYCYHVHPLGTVPVLVIEYLDGGNLRDWITQGKCAELKTGLDVAIQLCHALAHAHGNGVLHRDVKPENILLAGDGAAKLTDFGTARQPGVMNIIGHPSAESSPGQTVGLIGTYEYMAPEQFYTAHDLDQRADIFALGVCMYEMLCGQRPYSIATGLPQSPPEPIRLRHDLELPKQLGDLMKRCVAWSREDRPDSAEAVRRELCQIYLNLAHESSAHFDLPPLYSQADSDNNRALSYWTLGNIRAAERAWVAALASDPCHADANYNYGLHLWRAGQLHDDAFVRTLRSLLSKGSDSWPVPLLLANVHLERADAKAALEVLEALPATHADHRDVHHAKLAASRWSANSAGFVMSIGTACGDRIAVSHQRQIALSSTWLNMQLWDIPSGRPISAFEASVVNQWANKTGPDPVALNEDATLAMSGHWGGPVILWKLPSGEKLAEFGAHTGQITALAFNNDSHIALSGTADGVISVWEIPSGRCLHTFRTGRRLWDARFSPDGRHILSSGDHAILWNWRQAVEAIRLEGHSDAIRAVCFDTSGSQAITGSDDSTVRLWDLTTGNCLRVCRCKSGGIFSVDYCGDRHAVSGGGDTTIRLWDLDNGRCVHTFEPELYRNWVRAYSTGSGSQILAANGHSPLTLWRWAHPGFIAPFRPSIETDIKAKLAAHATFSAELAGARHAIHLGDHSGAYRRISWARQQPGFYRNREASTLLSSLYSRLHRKRFVTAWPVSTTEEPALAGNWGPDPSTVLCTSVGDPYFHLLNLTTGKRDPLPMCVPKPQYDMCLSPNRLYAGIRVDQTVEFWDIRMKVRLRIIECPDLYHPCAISNDGRLAIMYGQGTLDLWDIRGGKWVRQFCGLPEFCGMVAAVSEDGCCVATAQTSGDLPEITLWDVDTGLQSARLEGHESYNTDFIFSQTGSQLLSANQDGTVRLWDTLTGRCLQVFKGHRASVNAVSTVPDSEVALSASDDRTLRLWHLGSGTCLHVFEGHTDCVRGARLTPEIGYAISFGDDGTVRTWFLDWELVGA
jgi:WD40 repeat protein/serine/threonine protein kinase